MASQGHSDWSASPGEDQPFPSPFVPRLDSGRAPSVISSRMTDIASEDGDNNNNNDNNRAQTSGTPQPRSPTSVARSASITKGPWHGSVRKNFAGFPSKRGSVTSTTAGSLGRSPSLTSRSHVPSLTSNAFFHPMSSQKLQAQRAGAARPPTVSQPQQQQHQEQQLGDLDDNATDVAGSVVQGYTPSPLAELQRNLGDDDNRRPPPSRGTEMTEQDTLERIAGTRTTSPSAGYYATGSITDSIRPLHMKPDAVHHAVNVSAVRSPLDLGNPSVPTKSSRSFRSTFLLPGSNEQILGSQNRSTDGAEKLSSTASSPRLEPVDSQGQQKPKTPPTSTQPQSKGRVYQFFDGNTVFWFGGRWQNTRHRPLNIATGIFAVTPCALFFVFEAEWLWHNVSPAVPIVFAYLTYICISSFIHASVSDPGVSFLFFYLLTRWSMRTSKTSHKTPYHDANKLL